MNPYLRGGLPSIFQPVRRKIFISYHHRGDQAYYDEFSRHFHDRFETVYDNSLDRIIESDNTEYVMRQIREQYLTGTSCTVILIGAQSHLRKYIDWEIKATLDKNHGLVGIILPSHTLNAAGEIIVPDRFLDNSRSGYAVWDHWSNLNSERLNQLIDTAVTRPKCLIKNDRAMRLRNG